MTANEILSIVYNDSESGTFPKPQTLFHFVGGNYGNDTDSVENVRSSGLQSAFGGWTDVSELLPNRPQGVFFWGEEMANHGSLSVRVQIEVADLDTSKLFAFPSELAVAADRMICGYELVEGVAEAMKLAQPVAYADYDGTFAAEWIYTEDIEASKIR